MRVMMTLIGLHLRRFFRRPSILITMLLPLFLVLLIGVFSSAEVEATLAVGVVLEEDSPKSEQFFEALQELQTPPVSVVLVEDAQQLEELVAAKAVEVGYVVPADFSKRLEEQNYKKLFTRLISPGTNMHMLSNTTMSAALLTLITDDVAAHYLEEQGVLDDEAFFALIEEGEISTSEFSASFDIATVRGGVQDLEQASSNEMAFRGILSLSAFLFFCLSSVQFGQDARSAFFTRLAPIVSNRCAALAGPVTVLILGSISMALSFGLAAGFCAALRVAVHLELLAILCYLLYLLALTYMLSVLLPEGNLFLTLLPFLLMASLILCPIFWDISQYVPGMHVVSSFLPAVLYFRVAAGLTWAYFVMAFGAVIFFLLGYWRSKKVR